MPRSITPKVSSSGRMLAMSKSEDAPGGWEPGASKALNERPVLGISGKEIVDKKANLGLLPSYISSSLRIAVLLAGLPRWN